MDSKFMGNKVYLRLNRGDDLLNNILKTCDKYNIKSATFSGIGACGKAVIGTYIPEKNDFKKHVRDGMLEMISLTGNVTFDTKKTEQSIHAHALFSYLDQSTNGINYFGGDLKAATILYTGEITIEPVSDGLISKKYDSITGIDVWNFE